MKFEVGEIAVYVDAVVDTWLNGRECTIEAVGPFEAFQWLSDKLICEEAADYLVSMSGEGRFLADENHLRKRHPPETPAEDQFQHDLGRWLGWKDRECIPLTPAQKAYVKQYGDIQPK